MIDLLSIAGSDLFTVRLHRHFIYYLLQILPCSLLTIGSSLGSLTLIMKSLKSNYFLVNIWSIYLE